MSKTPVVDVHTHIYPPCYISLLQARTAIPYVRTYPSSLTPRLVILPGEDRSDDAAKIPGRPIGPSYTSISEKLAFMDDHGIDISVISLANPWLDFLPLSEAVDMARRVNDEIESMCEAANGRLYAFGALPLSAPVDAVVQEIQRLKDTKHVRGVIMGTTGLGTGLDDPKLDPVWRALQELKMLVFLHPHYGLPKETLGPRADDYGHVLPLALGFPLETTIAVTRMLLSGVWDRHRNLKVLLAHSGGTIPFLAGRIESCIQHDGHLQKQDRIAERRSIWDVLKNNIYLDAVVYSDRSVMLADEISGHDRVLFGTDHPFFPPLEGDRTQWMSVRSNREAILSACGNDETAAAKMLGGNAVRVLDLQI
ncbi:MAG: hypothetical protein M1817_005718 [Caeruleum heppii]|nr:MAG: hypothetical protein M1817_005718 [Caeruleum heppii]